MAVTARFIDGVAYDDPEIAGVYENLHGTSFVVPCASTPANLAVVSSGAANAQVYFSAGIAQVLGYFYENTAYGALTLDAQGGGVNRIDRIVLRRSAANQTIRATVIKGAAAAQPDIPALTADDMPLAWIWVPDGFGAATQVQSYNIHDDRIFGSISFYHDTESMDNLLPNSEWLAWSVPATTVAPDYWNDNIAAGSIAATTILGDAPRGQGAQVTLANGEYFECSIPAPVETYEDKTLTTLTLWGNILISSGTYIEMNVFTDPGTVVHSTKRLYRTTTYHTFTERITLDYATYSTATSLVVRYYNGSGGNVTFKCDPPILTKGFIAGPPRPKHEILMFTKLPVTDANWNLTAKSSGTTQIDLSAAFGGYIPSGVRAVIGRLQARDSGSAAAAGPLGAEVLNYYPNSTQSGGRVELASAGNDKLREENVFAGVDIATRSFAVQVWASGANTCDVLLVLTGIAT